MKYLHLASRVFNTPLLISADKADIIAAVLMSRMRGGLVDAPEIDDDEPDEPQSSKAGSIAVISIAGSLVHKSSGMMAESGMRSYLSITSDIESAVADESVKGILLRVDSPGGEVSGAWDCADTIFRAGQKKPVWAIAEDQALSAGYLLASQATRLFVSQTGLVGSVGIIMMHYDQSQADKQDGVKVTTMYRGKRKADFSPHDPLSAGAKAWAEDHLDKRYEQFVSTVVRGRPSLKAEAVRDTEAGIIDAQDAVRMKLADGLTSYRDAITEFSAFLGSKSGKRVSLAAAASASANPQKEGTRVSEFNTQADAASSPDTTELRKQIRSEALAEVAEVAAFCEVAGRPQLTASCIEQLVAGKTKAQVIAGIRKVKADATAASEVEIENAITTDAGATVGAARYSTSKKAETLGTSLAEMQKQAQGVK